MKLNKIIAFSLVILFLAANSNIGSARIIKQDQISIDPEWIVDTHIQLVYNITLLNYNNTEKSMPVDDEYGNYVGNITETNLLFVYVDDFTDTSTLSVLEGNIRGVETDNWGFNYTVPLSNDNSMGGHDEILLYPIIPVWETDAQEWNEVGTNFTSMDSNYSFDNNPTNFTLYYKNSTSLAEINVTWSKISGKMLYYYYHTLNDGPEGEPMVLELDYLYCRDESQWEIEYLINQFDLAAWNVTKLEFNGNNTVEMFYDEYLDENYNITEADTFVIHFNEIWNESISSDGPPSWNGSMMTLDWNYYWEFDMDQTGLNDGPPLFMPLMFNGNDNFYGNITDEFESSGAEVTVDSNILNITNNDVSVQWDRETGLLESYIYDGLGPDELPITLEIEFLYYYQNNPQEFAITAENHFLSYVCNVDNGTDDSILFGGSEEEGPFIIYDGDILDVHFESFDQYMNYFVSLFSNRGMFTQMESKFHAPGLENSDNGPPGLWFAVPVGDENLWTNTTEAYDNLGAITLNTADLFSINMTVYGIVDDTQVEVPMFVSGTWNKITGLLERYYIEVEINGEFVSLEFVQSIYMDFETLNHHWAVPDGIYVRYIANTMQNGTRNYLDFGYEDEYEYQPFMMYQGDLLGITLDNFTMESMYGPSFDGYISTNRGYKTIMGKPMMTTPGFEFTMPHGTENPEYDGGPPVLWFVIPISDNLGYYDDIASAWEDAGYIVTHTVDELGFEATTENFTVSVVWEKISGLLNYYYFDGEFDGQDLIMEFTRGTTLYPVDMEYDWEVNVGDNFEFHFTELDIDGDNYMPFDDNNYIYVNDTLTFTVDHLSSFAMGPPAVNYSIAVNSIINELFIPLVEPGWEFANQSIYGEYEYGQEGSGLPLFYPVIPVYGGSWDLFNAMYTESGYSVIEESGIFMVSHIFSDGTYFDVGWDTTTGVLQYYNASIYMDMGDGEILANMFLEIGPGSNIPIDTTTTTGTTTDTATNNDTNTNTDSAPTFTPGFEIFILSISAVCLVFIQRKKE